MPGFDNGVMYASNVDFTQTSLTSGSAQVLADGQLLIGSTASPNIKVGTLTAGTGITITNGSGSITVSSTASQTDLHVAKFIVNGTPNAGGNYTTIASAMAAAASGDTIFVMPGTYTENITLKDGVNITAFSCDGILTASSNPSTPNVILLGTVTCSFAGSATISGIQLKTNGAEALITSGGNSCHLQLVDCSINANNATGMTINSSTTFTTFYNCTFYTNSTNKLFSNTAGPVHFEGCLFQISGTASASDKSSASMTFNCCEMVGLPINQSAGTLKVQNCIWDYGATTLLTTSTAGTATITNSSLSSTTASCVSIGAGTIVEIFNSDISSTNANAITGAGTLKFSNLCFSSTSVTINTTTQTPKDAFLVPSGGTTDGIAYFDGKKLVTTAAGTAGQLIQSSGAGVAPAYTTATYPSTAGTSGNILTSDGTNFVSSTPSVTMLSTAILPLTNAQIKGMFVTPVEVIAAPAAGQIIVIVSWGIKLIYGGNNAFTGGGLIQLVDSGGELVASTCAASAITGTANNYKFSAGTTSTTTLETNYKGSNVRITNASGAFTGNVNNDNTATLQILYYILTM